MVAEYTEYLSLILAILLVTEEILAYSKCDANSILQLFTRPCGTAQNKEDIPMVLVVARDTAEITTRDVAL